jgi:hypothetical protein
MVLVAMPSEDGVGLALLTPMSSIGWDNVVLYIRGQGRPHLASAGQGGLVEHPR